MKDTLTPDELLSEIQKTEPDYNPFNTISLFGTSPAISDVATIKVESFLAMNLKPLEHVLHPCLPTQGIAFIYAATGLGKTLFALNIAYAIAQGGHFLNYTCPSPRKVLYVDGEMASIQLQSRLRQIKEIQGALDFENLEIITPDLIAPKRMPQVDEPFGQDYYIHKMQQSNMEVVIFDNLSMLASIDENNSREWKIVQDFLLQLRALGKTIIMIHHSGKDKNGYRGTSRMLDCADVAISLQPLLEENSDGDEVKGRKFKIVYQKARIFGGNDSLPLEVTLENGIWSSRSMEQTHLDKTVEMIGLKMSTRDIAKELLLSQSKVCRLIKKAYRLRLIRDESPSRARE